MQGLQRSTIQMPRCLIAWYLSREDSPQLAQPTEHEASRGSEASRPESDAEPTPPCHGPSQPEQHIIRPLLLHVRRNVVRSAHVE